MVLISNYSHLLNNIHTQSFNNLSVIFPNMIQNMYDINALNELYYSSYILNKSINCLITDIINNNPTDTSYNPLSDTRNYLIYNSLLGFLSKFSNNIISYRGSPESFQPQFTSSCVFTPIAI